LEPLLAISFNSFSSIWYWIITSIAWSLTCHVTMGVPYDMLTRAGRSGGQVAQDVDVLAQVHARRLAGFFEGSTTRIVFVMVITFLLAVLGTFGFYYAYELAAAMFMLIGPLILVQALSLRLSFRVRDLGLQGEELRAALLKRRFWNQVIGLVSIMASALVAFITFARNFAIWY